jgi:uncharacterized membrane protein
MSVEPITLAAILAMAAVTYLTRIAGLLVADRLVLSGRAKAAFEAIPPAVLMAVIAPTALATGWAETIAASITMAAATRLPLLGTVALGVATVVILRAILP